MPSSTRRANPKHTMPTGLPGVAPPGPAMPVVDTARCAPGEASSTPLAISSATGSLTAPK
ncbi:hypothetical protein AD428_21305 [Achromobacter sp. DMS1]|nr:hypothetical protein AD428_21305 [Achromobacter sp. DMS1]